MERADDNTIHTPQWYIERAQHLAGFMTPERAETMRRVLSQRTRYMTICTENTFHPQNASALARTCEAFGLQDMHTIEELCSFRPNVQIVKGSDKWMELSRHSSARQAAEALRAEGYRIVGTSPHTGGSTPDTFDVAAGPFALIFGTEHAGISPQAADSADEFIRIPMCGMADSLNVSASASILLHVLSSRMRSDSSIKWQLTGREQARLMYLWSVLSVKDARRILERHFE